MWKPVSSLLIGCTVNIAIVFSEQCVVLLIAWTGAFHINHIIIKSITDQSAKIRWTDQGIFLFLLALWLWGFFFVFLWTLAQVCFSQSQITTIHKHWWHLEAFNKLIEMLFLTPIKLFKQLPKQRKGS